MLAIYWIWWTGKISLYSLGDYSSEWATDSWTGTPHYYLNFYYYCLHKHGGCLSSPPQAYSSPKSIMHPTSSSGRIPAEIILLVLTDSWFCTYSWMPSVYAASSYAYSSSTLFYSNPLTVDYLASSSLFFLFKWICRVSFWSCSSYHILLEYSLLCFSLNKWSLRLLTVFPISTLLYWRAWLLSFVFFYICSHSSFFLISASSSFMPTFMWDNCSSITIFYIYISLHSVYLCDRFRVFRALFWL